MQKRQAGLNINGFTIVELLVVIVVIGILAAITIVSYTGVTHRVKVASLQSDLESTSKLLKLELAMNSGYPADLNDINNGNGLDTSEGNTLIDYQHNNSTNPQTFCIAFANGDTRYYMTNDSAPSAGDCLGIYATGGDVADIGGYRIHTFASDGAFTVNSAISSVEVLVVAGGGGGGVDRAGAGGAGGLIYDNSYSVTPQAYTITVGGGGLGTAANVRGVNGGNSVFDSLIAIGGGGGGTGNGQTGVNGGSGGGGGNSGAVNPCAGGLATSGQGNNGGLGIYVGPNYGAGGGGGAGGSGSNGTATSSGNGGVGLEYSISGSPVYYAGGGGAGSYGGGIDGIGGLGGGGNGGRTSAGAGAPNTGGGGGSSGNTIAKGGNGGSGVVIVRYLLP